MCKQYFQKWYDALTKPKETFKKEKKNASLSEAAKNIGLAGLIAGIIQAIVTLALSTSLFSVVFAAASIVLMPIVSIIAMLIGSGVLYLLAKVFGGKGNFNTQTYLFSLYQAPIILIATLVSFIPVAGIIIGFVIELYALYLLTLALKETHNYSTGKAIATWLVPMIILIVITLILAAVVAIWAQSLLVRSLGIPSY